MDDEAILQNRTADHLRRAQFDQDPVSLSLISPSTFPLGDPPTTNPNAMTMSPPVPPARVARWLS
jgi:hypothetical protein